MASTRSTKVESVRGARSDEDTVAERLPEEDAQADMLRLRLLDILELPEAHGDARRRVAAIDGIRRVRLGLARGIDPGIARGSGLHRG